MVLKIHALVSEDFALHAPETKIPILQRRGHTRTLGRMGPTFPDQGKITEKRAATAALRSHPWPLDSRQLNGLQWPSFWQEMDAVRGASLQKWSCSSPTAGRLSYGRVCCLRRPPRRRGATGKGMLFQGSLLHWR